MRGHSLLGLAEVARFRWERLMLAAFRCTMRSAHVTRRWHILIVDETPAACSRSKIRHLSDVLMIFLCAGRMQWHRAALTA